MTIPPAKQSSTNDDSLQVEQQTFPDIDQPKITNPLTSPVSIEAQSVPTDESVDARTSQKDQVLITEDEADSYPTGAR